MTRILIVDDYPAMRRGLKEILMRELKDAECEEAANAQEALAHLQERTWNLVILDLTMPGRSGLDVLGDIKAAHPRLPVLMWSVHSELFFGKRALQAGAAGYITKDAAPEELIKACRRLLAGGRYVGRDLAEWLAVDVSGERKASPHENLSNRELAVLAMIGSGRTISQIAGDLHLSATTVSTYRARILEKMGMTTTAELMRYAMIYKLAN